MNNTKNDNEIRRKALEISRDHISKIDSAKRTIKTSNMAIQNAEIDIILSKKVLSALDIFLK